MAWYRIDTDAAVQHSSGNACIAFLAMKNTDYIYKYYRSCVCSNTAWAESYAFGAALKYVVDVLKPSETDELVIYCDNLYVVKYARIYKSGCKNGVYTDKSLREPTKAIWLKDVYDYIPKIKCKWSIIKIKSHTGVICPHNYVDRLAKIGLSTNILSKDVD